MSSWAAPMWRQLMKARLAFAPARAALAKTGDKRNCQVWYTVCARRGSVGAWDEAAMEVPFFCSSNNSQTGMAHCDSSACRRENPVLG